MRYINSFKGKYDFLSNFYPCHIKYKGKIYRTSEHLFQALKTKDKKQRAKIRRCFTPGQAKKEGRQVTLREDWQQIKNDIMYLVLKLKFKQHPTLALKLIRTSNHKLIEGNTWHDDYWGNCTCGRKQCNREGHNQLGKTLMKIRIVIKEERK